MLLPWALLPPLSHLPCLAGRVGWGSGALGSAHPRVPRNVKKTTFMLFSFFSQGVSYLVSNTQFFFRFSKEKVYQGQNYQVPPLTSPQQCPRALDPCLHKRVGVQWPAAGCSKGTIPRDKWNLSPEIIILSFRKRRESWGHMEPECDELGEEFVSAN